MRYSNDPNAFNNKPKLQRLIILASGAFMNIVLGLFIMLLCVSFSENLYSNTIEQFLIKDTNGEFITEYNGIELGDKIIKIGNEQLNVRYDYVFAAMRARSTPCDITVVRDGSEVIVSDFIFPTFVEKGIEIGNPSFFIPATKTKNIFTILHDTFFQTLCVVKMVIYSLADIIMGNFSPEAVSGPVGVVSEIHETAKVGVLPLLFLTSMITINIGVFNLLPFPGLDGFRILFIFIELFIRRPLNKKAEGIINYTGILILFSLMLLITFKDIISLFN